MAELSEQKQAQRAMWAGGEYAIVAERIAGAGEAAVEAAGIGQGDKVLDVACGTGNASIPAAKAGGEVTGLDLTPKLLEQARERASEEGVEIEFIEGDAEDLSFEDETFDAVTSVFGSMFAPDHRKAAAEMARVLKPGGRLAVCAWTPEGAIGRMFITTGSHLPAPPEGFQPPVLWGDESHVTGLFEGTGVDVEIERTAVKFEFDSMDAAMKEAEDYIPPLVAAKAALEPEGKWDALRSDLVDMYTALNDSGGEALTYDAEYLIVKGTKA